jgi:hypothetical protein
MGHFLLRLAALACGLLLALPPGWCCLWLPQPARASAPPPVAPQCPCCHPVTPAELPTEAPAPSGRCPCADREATTPEAVKAPALQAGDCLAAVPAAGADLEASAAPHGLPSPAGYALPSAPLHVLHCVWLC